MPTLEITAASFAPEHAAATFDYIRGIMLWPTDCDDRREFYRTAAADRKRRAAAAAPGLPIEPGLHDDLFDAQPWRVLKPVIMVRQHIGLRVGYFFAAAVGIPTWGTPGKALSVGELLGKVALADAKRRRPALHPALDVGVKVLERDLRDFQSVRTLWAAAHISATEGVDAFRPHRLADFLALTEWVRGLALAVRTKKGTPLLLPDTDVWRPPTGLDLPSWRLGKL